MTSLHPGATNGRCAEHGRESSDGLASLWGEDTIWTHVQLVALPRIGRPSGLHRAHNPGQNLNRNSISAALTSVAL
jgi:hypothetical protein